MMTTPIYLGPDNEDNPPSTWGQTMMTTPSYLGPDPPSTPLAQHGPQQQPVLPLGPALQGLGGTVLLQHSAP